MLLLALLLQVSFAREIAATESPLSCAEQLNGLGCEDPKLLAERHLTGYMEELAHGHRLLIVPCVGGTDFTMYVALWGQEGKMRALKFDQWSIAGQRMGQEQGLLTAHLKWNGEILESEGFGLKSKYRFQSRPDGVTVHLLEQTRPREDGTDEYFYWQRH